MDCDCIERKAAVEIEVWFIWLILPVMLLVNDHNDLLPNGRVKDIGNEWNSVS